jgi:hypothetical protein
MEARLDLDEARECPTELFLPPACRLRKRQPHEGLGEQRRPFEKAERRNAQVHRGLGHPFFDVRLFSAGEPGVVEGIIRRSDRREREHAENEKRGNGSHHDEEWLLRALRE